MLLFFFFSFYVSLFSCILWVTCVTQGLFERLYSPNDIRLFFLISMQIFNVISFYVWSYRILLSLTDLRTMNTKLRLHGCLFVCDKNSQSIHLLSSNHHVIWAFENFFFFHFAYSSTALCIRGIRVFSVAVALLFLFAATFASVFTLDRQSGRIEKFLVSYF